MVQACIDALRKARDEAAADVRDALAGIGISSPGPLNPWTGTILEPPNLGPRFRDIPLAADVRDALHLPTFLDRDTNVAALAEWTYGAARGCDDFLYLTVSTGFGGAVVSGGRLLVGPDGTAGELGHMTVDFDGPRCGCGGIGHVEAIASGVALARLAEAAVEAGQSPFLAARAAEPGRSASDLDARDVAEGEDTGEPTCAAMMATFRLVFARAMVSYVDLFDPDRIIVGGAIAEHQGDRLLGPARERIAAEAFRTPAARVAVLPPVLGPDVSLAGAHPLVMSRLEQPASGRSRTRIALRATA